MGAALDAAFANPPPPKPEDAERPWYLKPFERGADPRKLFTEGVPNAARAFASSFPTPESVYERHPWTRYFKPAAAATHAVETVMATPNALQAAVAELGPEKAKPLTEALTGIAISGPRPLLARGGPHSQALYERYVAPRGIKPLVTFPDTPEVTPQRALPPGATRALPPARPPVEETTVPSFWPNKPQLPPGARPELPGQIGLPKQLPPPRLGENLRSRTYFPERTPYKPETPLEVKGGSREGELLDQYGRPVKAGEPTMTERERLRTLYKGRLGEAKPRLEEPPTPPVKPPEPSPKPIAEIPRGQSQPFIEKTKIGDQAMIGGTEARAIPTSKLASKAPQSKLSDSPLFAKPETAVQQPLGQHYGKTVSPGTAILSDPEEVRMLIRDYGGIDPASIGLDVAATPKEFLRKGGRSWDEIITDVAQQQGKRPKQVEREIGQTLSRYNTLREELKGDQMLQQIRGAEPPPGVGVSKEEWQHMGPGDRKAAIEWFKDVFSDESGALNIDKMIDAWRRFRRRLPYEERVRKVVPDSPATSEIERWNVDLATAVKNLSKMSWWQGVKKMNPNAIKDAEEIAVNQWKTGGSTPASRAAAEANMPAAMKDAAAYRRSRFAAENRARAYFNLDPIPEEPGPYVPRRTDKEAREAVSLGGGRMGVGRGLQTTVRGHQQQRAFETYKQGEGLGTVYEDPRNGYLWREWDGLKLRATQRIFQNLEQKGVLFKNRAQATAASPTKPYLIENAPGGEWWARTEEEARLLEQNLTESIKGPTGSFLHYGNMLFRNPNLVLPFPHIVKNMWAKALLARGPVGLVTVPRDAVEYFKGWNPTLLAEFKDAMPFSRSGATAGEILGNELRHEGFADAVHKATKVFGALNKPSSKVVFEWADPAMRYSLFKHYRGKGLSPYAAANNAWVDLIRYGTRSDLVDIWKSWPFNFFVPWRYGTLVSLVKQVKNHPIRTAMLVAGIDYLRETRYRSAGKWTHLPWDYTENPVAIVMQNHLDGKKSAGQQVGEAASILATTRLFGPGGAFAAGQLVDALNDIRGKPDWTRVQNMFWGISQLYNLPKEWQAYQQTGDTKILADMVATAMLGEHNAYTYQPRRLMRDLPEWLPGMQRSPAVREAEARQEQREQRSEKIQQYRQTHPKQSIEDRLREGGYIR